MDKEYLKKEFNRFLVCDTIGDSLELLDIYIEFCFQVITDQNVRPKNKEYLEAEIILQMMFTKMLNLKTAIHGVEYHSNNGKSLSRIIDPTIIASSIRNIYESVAMFHIVYVLPKTDEERKLLYNLWVISGLSYRQRFESSIINAESRKKQEDEKQQISDLTNEIKQMNLFKNLDLKNQLRIDNLVKEKEYKVRIQNGKIIKLSWQEIIPIMGIRSGIMDNLYTYFSLYAHPSNVSVFQFQNMFSKGSNTFVLLANFNFRNAIILLSIFISDYLKTFPLKLPIFNTLNIRDQIAISVQNFFARGVTYSINNCIDELN